MNQQNIQIRPDNTNVFTWNTISSFFIFCFDITEPNKRYPFQRRVRGKQLALLCCKVKKLLCPAKKESGTYTPVIFTLVFWHRLIKWDVFFSELFLGHKCEAPFANISSPVPDLLILPQTANFALTSRPVFSVIETFLTSMYASLRHFKASWTNLCLIVKFHWFYTHIFQPLKFASHSVWTHSQRRCTFGGLWTEPSKMLPFFLTSLHAKLN